MTGPQVPFSAELHATKYRTPGEDFETAMNRIAGHLADEFDNHFQLLSSLLLTQGFMPAGRVQASSGSTKAICAHNCFVSGIIEDSFTDGHGSIMARAGEAAETMRKGGGIGYDFSTIRPRGALIKKLQSQASGPLSFMEIYEAVCKCVASAGHRRGAQMGVLRVDHPDIEEFIAAKCNRERFRGFNFSVAITDKFMECLKSGEPFPLVFDNVVYKEIDASVLWEQLMHATWDWAEPGVLFIDTINRMNNLAYCETITATNPCGEQPLPPYGACLLGSVNLVKYLRRVAIGEYEFDWDRFAADIPVAVRAMDNVIDRAIYPIYEQEKEAKSKRRMGIGVTGLANCIEAQGHAYGSPEFLAMTDRIMRRLTRECYLASAALAGEKGAFPLYREDEYLNSEFVKTLDPVVQEAIRANGIRNSHLVSVAPTGTISLCADNISSGIEPVFAYSFERTVQEFDGPRVETVEDYGVRVLNVRGRRSQDVTVEQHLAVLATVTKHVDSAVSKTCNVGSDVSWTDFKQIYYDAWEQGCKGCTTFRADGEREGVLNVKEEDSQAQEADFVGVAADPEEFEEGAACYRDPVTGRSECE